MKSFLTLAIILILNTVSFANELQKTDLITLPIEAKSISKLHDEFVGKTLKSFFVKYGKSETLGGFGITIYYYKTTNFQTVMVGTADLKTIIYIQLTK